MYMYFVHFHSKHISTITNESVKFDMLALTLLHTDVMFVPTMILTVAYDTIALATRLRTPIFPQTHYVRGGDHFQVTQSQT